MAIAIPEWVPKFIQQAVEYRERQKVTHERLNELFNLLITQGDWNATTLETINTNLAAFDLQYLADFNANTDFHNTLLANFTNTINQIKADNATAIANLDTQQRLLLAEMLVTFQAELSAVESRINTQLAATLASITVLHDEMLAKEAEFDADMQTLTNTVENLRATILQDNQAIAAQIQADKAAIEAAISDASGIMQNATQIIATQDAQAEDIADINQTLINKAESIHSHTKADVSDFEHTHTKDEVIDFVHTHTLADVPEAAPVANPTFTGTAKATNNTDYATAQLRNISAGTADLTAGVSALPSGSLYVVYE